MVIESGSVDQKPRLIKFVASAMKTCCVRAKPVSPIASNIAAALDHTVSTLLSFENKVETRGQTTHKILLNILTASEQSIPNNFNGNREDKHLGPAKNLREITD